MSSLPAVLERPMANAWVELDDEFDDIEVTDLEYDVIELVSLEPDPQVFDSIESMKDAPIVLRGEAAAVFAQAKRRRTPRSANPIPFD